MSLIVCAHNEEGVIAAKVANALALDWPRELLEVVVCSDGSDDATVAAARAAGADVVLDLPWAGKVRAQDAGAQAGRGELLAFSDANVLWEPGALAALAAAFDDPRVGYACGRISFVQAAAGPDADNQEDVYWRFEMAVRGAESRFASITAGNGGIHAVRRDAYLVVGDLMDHDLTFPFSMVKRGWRAVDVPARRQREDGALAGRRVRAQAADDGLHLGDRAAQRDAAPRRLRPALRLDDPQPPRAALQRARVARARPRLQHRAGRDRRRPALHRHPGGAAGADRGAAAARGSASAIAAPLVRP